MQRLLACSFLLLAACESEKNVTPLAKESADVTLAGKSDVALALLETASLPPSKWPQGAEIQASSLSVQVDKICAGETSLDESIATATSLAATTERYSGSELVANQSTAVVLLVHAMRVTSCAAERVTDSPPDAESKAAAARLVPAGVPLAVALLVAIERTPDGSDVLAEPLRQMSAHYEKVFWLLQDYDRLVVEEIIRADLQKLGLAEEFRSVWFVGARPTSWMMWFHRELKASDRIAPYYERRP